MLQKIEEVAEISVARGCGFAALAILTLMIGLSWDMMLASKVGGGLVLLVCMVLIVRARGALRQPVRNTELWMMLDACERPDPAVAQRVLGAALRTCYLRFALHAICLSIVFLTLSLSMHLVGKPAPEFAFVDHRAER